MQRCRVPTLDMGLIFAILAVLGLQIVHLARHHLQFRLRRKVAERTRRKRDYQDESSNDLLQVFQPLDDAFVGRRAELFNSAGGAEPGIAGVFIVMPASVRPSCSTLDSSCVPKCSTMIAVRV